MERARTSAATIRFNLLHFFRKFAVMAAVERIDHQSNNQPGEEAQPGQNGQSGHQQNAKQHTQHRRGDATRSAESAMATGIAIAQDDHADRYQHKGK